MTPLNRKKTQKSQANTRTVCSSQLVTEVKKGVWTLAHCWPSLTSDN